MKNIALNPKMKLVDKTRIINFFLLKFSITTAIAVNKKGCR